MALTTNDSIITRGFIKTFYDRLKSMFALKTVKITCTGALDGGGSLEADRSISHKTTSGYKHIPSGGSSGQVLVWSADGTAAWGTDNNTTYTFKTTTVPNVTDVGSLPTTGTSISADDITAWSAGSITTTSVSNGCLKITTGSVPSLSYTERTIPNLTGLGTLPSLGTSITVISGATEN